MLLPKITLFAIIMLSYPAAAEPIADLSGVWRGSGWAKETPKGPRETVRCRIENVYDNVTRRLKLSALCVVPGRKLKLSGSLQGKKGSEQISGRWSNPNGIGSVRVVGTQRGNIVSFTFKTTRAVNGRRHAQNVEWRISKDSLRLRSVERSDPNNSMSEISFSR